MRTYKVKRGARDKFIEVLRTTGFAELKRIGVKCAGPFASIEDETTIFWMRGFPDEASRGPMSNQFYGGDAWKNELADAFMPNLEKYDVVAVEMPESAVQWV
ncbi:MAG TPA: hypothetical protein VGC27_13790 [Rhizomicrobium sp.]